MRLSQTLTVVLVMISTAARAAAQNGRDETGLLPEGWSIDIEAKQLETSAQDISGVIKSLGSASTELRELLSRHLGNPSDRVTSSSLERMMAAYASDAVRDFDRIISSQDSTLSTFRSLGRKLERFDSYLGAKIESTRLNAAVVKREAEAMVRQLEEMAPSVRHAPSPEVERESKERFFRLYHRYELQKRYAEGDQNTCEGYRRLSAHLEQLRILYGTLRDKFSTLVGSLETERRFLLDNMGLQEDSLKVTALVRDGLASGRGAIGKITEKLALLLLKVDAFNVISTRVTTNLDTLNDFQHQMIAITEKLQQVGAGGDPKSLDDAVDQIYRERIGEDKEANHDRKK